MPLIKDGSFAEDAFITLGDEDAIPNEGDIIVSFDRWQAEKEHLKGLSCAVGIRIKPDQSPEDIKDDLEHLSAVHLEFPVFRDGRGYSQARLLRARYGFGGEIRATGNVLRDQLAFMKRVGIDAFEVDERITLPAYADALAEVTNVYQPSTDGLSPIFALRQERRRASA